MTWQAAIGPVRRRYISGTFGLVPAYRGTRLNTARSVSKIMLHIPLLTTSRLGGRGLGLDWLEARSSWSGVKPGDCTGAFAREPCKRYSL